MTAATTPTVTSGTVTGPARARARSLVVIGAAVAAVVVWGLSRAAGTDLLVTAGDGEPPTEITVPWVTGFALLASLLGWAALALAERLTSSPARVWTIAAVVVLLVSLSAPYTADAGTATQNWLALMHLAVAAVLIPGLHRTVAPPLPRP